MLKKKIKNAKIEENEVAEKEKKKIAKKEQKVQEEKKQEKIEKTNKILDEIKAFLILATIIAAVVLGCWYWFTNVYNSDGDVNSKREEKNVDQYKSTKYIAAADKYLDIINEKYIIEYKDNTLYKVMDMNTEVLFEGEEKFGYAILGTDEKLYFITDEEIENGNSITISRIENGQLEEVKTIVNSDVYYEALIYQDDNKKELIGFTGVSSAYDEELNEINKAYLYTLDGKEYEISDIELYGDTKDQDKNIISYDKYYVIIKSYVEGKNLYGLYDIEKNEIIIKPQYEGLYSDNGNYIAIKDGKYGIITDKLKKVVNFDYDFIDRNDDYYVVAKNGKMAIMDEDYKVITKYDFDYQKSGNGIEYNANDKISQTFATYEINDKYILTINNCEITCNLNYNKHETYIILENGTYTTIKADEFVVRPEENLIYSYNKTNKKYTIYDNELKEKYSIDVSDYDYNKFAPLNLVNGNTLVLSMDSKIYYDYETGEEIDSEKDYSTEVNGLTINYDSYNREVTYKFESEKIATIDAKNKKDSDITYNFYEKLNDNTIYYATLKEYVMIKKGE